MFWTAAAASITLIDRVSGDACEVGPAVAPTGSNPSGATTPKLGRMTLMAANRDTIP